MEISKGFIVGIFNYCDRWCETCAFTARCGLFADTAEMEASLDPGLKPIVDAPPLPAEVPPPPPGWMQDLIARLNEAASEAMADESIDDEPKLPPDHAAIQERAHDYCMRVHAWLADHPGSFEHNPSDPRSVVTWFHTMIPPKVHRALSGLAEDQDDYPRGWPSDSDGSAKVALLGIDRSHAAWLELMDQGLATAATASAFIADLVWLGEELERIFPHARAFVRPAFDEPDELSRLRAED